MVRDALALIRNLQVRLVPIDHLFPYIRNSRTHTDAQVALYLPLPFARRSTESVCLAPVMWSPRSSCMEAQCSTWQEDRTAKLECSVVESTLRLGSTGQRKAHPPKDPQIQFEQVHG